jgi:hypothetical protein
MGLHGLFCTTTSAPAPLSAVLDCEARLKPADMRTVALAGKGYWGHPCRQRPNAAATMNPSHPSGAQWRHGTATPEGPGNALGLFVSPFA